MKPKDLKSPFSWEERKVLLHDGVLFVPEYYFQYAEFTFPGWSDPLIFGNEREVRIEVCSGNGQWIIEKAKENPEVNWVAMEIRFDRCRKIWSKAKNMGIKNLFIVCGEAITAMNHYFPSKTVSEMYLNFPDPWPKERHAKHRIVQEPFCKEVSRLLKEGGKITLVTDDAPYLEQMLSEFQKFSEFQKLFLKTDLEGYGGSYFDSLWRSKSRIIQYLAYAKATS